MNYTFLGAIIALVGFFIFAMAKSPRRKAIRECVRLAAELQAASHQDKGDTEALDKFDIFSELVEKNWLTHRDVKVQSFAYILHCAHDAAQKAYAGDTEMQKVIERFYKDHEPKYRPPSPAVPTQQVSATAT